MQIFKKLITSSLLALTLLFFAGQFAAKPDTTDLPLEPAGQFHPAISSPTIT